jgi:hypothetical protein
LSLARALLDFEFGESGAGVAATEEQSLRVTASDLRSLRSMPNRIDIAAQRATTRYCRLCAKQSKATMESCAMEHRYTTGSTKRLVAHLIPLLLAFGSGCTGELDDSNTDDADATTEDTASALGAPGNACQGSIGAVPANVKPIWTHETYTKYLYMPTYKIHFFATAGVGNDKILAICSLVQNMTASLKSSTDRAKMGGHKIHINTIKDPGLPGTSPPQRDGGAGDGTLLTFEAICGSPPVDPTNPKADRRYRGWDVPVHEFGHSIEIRLGYEARSNQLFSKEPGYNQTYAREYFAWATQYWFSSDVFTKYTRSTMKSTQRDYLSTIFNAGSTWVPKCR